MKGNYVLWLSAGVAGVTWCATRGVWQGVVLCAVVGMIPPLAVAWDEYLIRRDEWHKTWGDDAFREDYLRRQRTADKRAEEDYRTN